MEKLPEEILIEIFEYLMPEDKDNFALVCESWHNIIASSQSLMKRHALKIDFVEIERNKKPWLQLPYRNFYLVHINDKSIDAIESFTWLRLPNRNFYFERICDRIKYPKETFESFTSDIEDVDKVVIKYSQLAEVVKFLTHFENISMLITENINAWESKDKTVINLPNLTHFKFDTSASGLLPKINHKVKFMHVKMAESELTEKQEKDLGEFFQNCEDLKHLTLEEFYTDEILEIKSQLETLELIEFWDIPESVIKFLEIQKSSLKNLSLSGTLNAELSNFILFEMNLEKVFVDGFEFFEIKAHKISLKNFSISYGYFDQFPKLAQFFESLEVLSINLPEKPLEFLHSIFMLPKLKVLFLKGNSKIYDGELNLTFNRLERLAFSNGFKKNECLNIIRCCPNLKRFEMKYLLTLDEFERIFEICKELQEISFIGVSKVKDEEIQTFKRVGEKINIKIEVVNKKDYEKFFDVKNRLTVMIRNKKKRVVPFVVTPKVLTHLWPNYNIQEEDYFYESDDEFKMPVRKIAVLFPLQQDAS